MYRERSKIDSPRRAPRSRTSGACRRSAEARSRPSRAQSSSARGGSASGRLRPPVAGEDEPHVEPARCRFERLESPARRSFLRDGGWRPNHKSRRRGSGPGVDGRVSLQSRRSFSSVNLRERVKVRERSARVLKGAVFEERWRATGRWAPLTEPRRSVKLSDEARARDLRRDRSVRKWSRRATGGLSPENKPVARRNVVSVDHLRSL